MKEANKLAYFYLIGFEVFTEVPKKSAVFWDVPPYSLERVRRPLLDLLFNPEERGDMFL
jgi:hypothetical protein